MYLIFTLTRIHQAEIKNIFEVSSIFYINK